MEKEKDIQEIEVSNKGAVLGSIFSLVLALIYFTYEIFTGQGTNPALYSIITIYSAVLFGYKAIKVEKSRKLNCFTSIVWGLLTLMLILSYFKVL